MHLSRVHVSCSLFLCSGWRDYYDAHADEVKRESPEKFDPLFSPKKEAALVDLNVEVARRWSAARMEAQAKRQRVRDGRQDPDEQADVLENAPDQQQVQQEAEAA